MLLRVKRLEWELGQPYPAGRRYVYACKRCGVTVESLPTHVEPWSCACRNITVDADAGRCSVRDHAWFEVLERE
jgi:hypothetical protein